MVDAWGGKSSSRASIWDGGSSTSTSDAEANGLRRSLLSSQARIQVPWVKVTIGSFTFGVFDQSTRKKVLDNANFYTAFEVQYPDFIQSLEITKINGQINTYNLSINYPVTSDDDPNFFDKVFASVSNTRRIVFSYGDASQPNYIYKDEEAIITDVQQTFSFGSGATLHSVIGYRVQAVSAAALSKGGVFNFINSGYKKPSDEIKRVVLNSTYGLRQLFSGVTSENISKLVAGDDKAVKLETKTNMSALDYINYLAGCMIPASAPTDTTNSEIYVLTIHDDTTYDEDFKARETVNGKPISGPYLRVTKTSYKMEKSDAYNVDIGVNTSNIVTNFSINNNETYALYFDYTGSLSNKKYVRRINNAGEYEDVYAPTITSNNDTHATRAEDTVWWTKLTKYPISAELTIQGLLRPATLMQYVRLNVIFPGGNKHTSSGLYIVTKQVDSIGIGTGYKTQLSLTRLNT